MLLTSSQRWAWFLLVHHSFTGLFTHIMCGARRGMYVRRHVLILLRWFYNVAYLLLWDELRINDWLVVALLLEARVNDSAPCSARDLITFQILWDTLLIQRGGIDTHVIVYGSVLRPAPPVVIMKGWIMTYRFDRECLQTYIRYAPADSWHQTSLLYSDSDKMIR